MKILNPFHLFILFTIIASFSFACKENEIQQDQALVTDYAAIQWIDITELETKVKREPKPIFVMVYANWCPHCKNFDQTTYQNPKVIAALNEDFYPVKLNAHDNREITYQGTVYKNPNWDPAKGMNKLNAYHELLYAIQAKSIPSLVFMDQNFTYLGTELGFKESDDLRSLLNMYKSQ